MSNIRFTATAEYYDTRVFENEDQFIQYLDSHWDTNSFGRRFQARCLLNEEPDRYPCIMISCGQRELQSGRDEIQNIFLYDVVVHEEEEEPEAEAA